MVPNEKLDPRDPLIEYVFGELVGPAKGERETLSAKRGSEENPDKRYIMGVLYPTESSAIENANLHGSIDGDQATDNETVYDESLTLAFQYLPSACGLSFLVSPETTIRIGLRAGTYEKDDTESNWIRSPIPSEGGFEYQTCYLPESISVNKRMRENYQVLGDKARLHLIWRQQEQGFLVSAMIVNDAQKSINPRTQRSVIDPAQCLYQVSMVVEVVHGEIFEYPHAAFFSNDQEAEEHQLLYRKYKGFAIGHGCSAEWETNEDGAATLVKTTFMPTYTLPGLSFNFDTDSPQVCQMEWLGDEGIPAQDLSDGLNSFIDQYENWITDLARKKSSIPIQLGKAADRVLLKLQHTLQSMRQGVLALESDKEALTAFRLSHKAMLHQMKVRRPGITDPSWYPFQLAYQLVTLDSLINADSADREVVDLLWVPTGGGKTEAYLLISAFEIFRRRLKHRDAGAGTTIISRYTLRLLTSQQFQRAATLICACEFIRKRDPNRFGTTPITIGLWVGGDQTPNSYGDAVDKYNIMREGQHPKNTFPLLACPWCQTPLLPQEHSANDGAYGFSATNTTFGVHCVKESCDFHKALPIGFVDDYLYQSPPTFLLATVDKFARLAWEERAGIFFGGTNNVQPPSIIIQDELHLMTGPLGTTVGIYESAVSALLTMKGVNPKVLASTATIRRPDLQIQGLYGREPRVFPPVGLDSDDSYFVRTEPRQTRNRYVGIMSSGHTATTSWIRTSGAVLQGRTEKELEIQAISPAALDGYWTAVMYHNSLWEIGGTSKYIRDDIPAWMKTIASAEDMTRDIDPDRDVIELRGSVAATDIAEQLAKLNITYAERGALSAVLCTNMFSVGVDEQRLGLMLVHGQPKSTAEYIQATGRVGRGDVPGLILTHYSGQKARDRSHYETFWKYHAGMYSYVEPSSVTPFARPSRDRALHAALIIIMRHGLGLNANDFRRNSADVGKAVSVFLDIVKKVDPEELSATKEHVERLLTAWEKATSKEGEQELIYFGQSPKGINRLMKSFNDPDSSRGFKPPWATLNNMRHVDTEIGIEVSWYD